MAIDSITNDMVSLYAIMEDDRVWNRLLHTSQDSSLDAAFQSRNGNSYRGKYTSEEVSAVTSQWIGYEK